MAASLAVDAGGFPMAFHAHPNRLFPIDCDLSVPGAGDALLAAARERFGTARPFSFINLGVTLQWAAAADGDPIQRHNGRALVLQEIIRNELLFALGALRPGGALLVTLPAACHPNSFLYLRLLRACGGDGIGVRIVPTPYPERDPVYVWVASIDVASEAVAECELFLRETVVSSATYASWLDDWATAAPTFAACRDDLEAAWGAQTAALRASRLDAENRALEEGSGV